MASKRKKSDIVDESVGMNEEFVESTGPSLVSEKELAQKYKDKTSGSNKAASAFNADMFSRGKRILSLAKVKRPELQTQNRPRVFNKSRVEETAGAVDRAKKEAKQTSVQELDPSLLKKKKDKPIGSGSFGDVFLAEYRGIKTVVKEVKKRNESRSETERCKREVLHEARMLRYLGDHPNLPFLFGVILEREPYALVTQFHGTEGESLTLHKAARKKVLCKKSTAIVFKNIAKTVEHIHTKGVVHNDLKANNVLIQRDSEGNYQPVVIDFGKSEEITKLTARTRTGDYIAPEVREGQKQSTASDIFSFGIMLESCVSNRSFKALFSELIVSATSRRIGDRPSAREVVCALNDIIRGVEW